MDKLNIENRSVTTERPLEGLAGTPKESSQLNEYNQDALELGQITRQNLKRLFNPSETSGVETVINTLKNLGRVTSQKPEVLEEKYELIHSAAAGDPQRLERLIAMGGGKSLQVLLDSNKKQMAILQSLLIPGDPKLDRVQERIELIAAEMFKQPLPALRVMDKFQIRTEALDAEAHFITEIHKDADAKIEFFGAKLAETESKISFGTASKELTRARENAETALKSTAQSVEAARVRLMPVINQSISAPPQTAGQIATTVNNLSQQLALLEALMSTPGAAQDPKIAAQIKALQKKIAELKALQNTQKPDKVQASVSAQLSNQRHKG